MLNILFRDSRLVIVDKPAGLPVHAGPRGGPSVEDYFSRFRKNLRRGGPWLAHRLDADTSGCLAIALTKTALIAAQAAFASGAAGKTYWALVRGAPASGAQSGRIAAPMRKISSARGGWRMVAEDGPDAAPSVSTWRLLATGDGVSLVEVRPRTGRTHQVRVHCALLGCPILGDAVYGGPPGQLCLLARRLCLPLVPPAEATAPVPAHMKRAAARHPAISARLAAEAELLRTGNVSSPFPKQD